MSESREAIRSVRHHIEVGWVHDKRAGHHTDALGQQCHECIPIISMPCGGPVGSYRVGLLSQEEEEFI